MQLQEKHLGNFEWFVRSCAVTRQKWEDESPSN